MATAASEVTVSLGLMSFRGKLQTLKRSEYARTALKNICPVCAEQGIGVAGKSQAICPEHPEHGPFSAGEMAKGKQVDKNHIVPLSADELEALKADDGGTKVLEVNVYSAEDVEDQTWPDDSAWVFTPSKGSEQAFSVFVDLVSDRARAFVGKVQLSRGNEKMVRLLATPDAHLVFQSLVRPENVIRREASVYSTPDERLSELAEQLVSSMEDVFDPTEYASQKLQRHEELLARLEGREHEVAALPKEEKSETPDLMAVLEASLKKAS